MEMTTMEYFLAWYGKIRKVTNEVLKVVPPGQLDWTYMSGKFTIGDLIRHIAAIERLVFAEIAIGNKPAYVAKIWPMVTKTLFAILMRCIGNQLKYLSQSLANPLKRKLKALMERK